MSWKRGQGRGRPLRLALAVLLMGVGCLAGTFLAINASPRLLLALLGLERSGSLADALPPEPAPLSLGGEPLDHVELVLPPRMEEPLTVVPTDADEGRLPGAPFIGDVSTPGKTRYLLTLDEREVNELLWDLILPNGLDQDRYRSLAIDLRPGGLIAYSDVDLGIRWQRVGLLLLQDGRRLTLSPAGFEMNGELYAMPESGSLARLLLPAGARARHTLYGLTIVGPLPGEARVEEARFHEDHLQVVAEATYSAAPAADTGWREVERGVELREIDVTPGAGGLTERLSIVRLNPSELWFRVHYDPANPKTISAWGAALDGLLVVNGGYFAPESEGRRETIGLLVSDGERWGRPLQDYAGMLAVTRDDEVSVRWLRQRPFDPEEPLAQVVQSFPVLVKPGGSMGFPADGDEGARSRRTVVAQDRAGDILFIVAPRGALSLHGLAVFLADSDLLIDVALNLDGGGSTGMWLGAADGEVAIDSLAPVPSVIAVGRR